jgi:hypothetical protein
MIKKSFSILSYLLAVASLVILIKTELRKWFAFGGDPSSANTVIFWGALILCVVFFYIGNKLWIKKTKEFLKTEQSKSD